MLIPAWWTKFFKEGGFISRKKGVRVTTLSGLQPDHEFDQNPVAPAPIDKATGMHEDYWVLAKEERAKGFIRPVRTQYVHVTCAGTTGMALALAETYARDPKFYARTFCRRCKAHFPVGPEGQFIWYGTNEKVGT